MMPVSPAAPPFTREALAILFERSNFRAFQKPGALSHYWAPLISACSGARRNELFFLTPDDIRPKDGTVVIRIKAAGPGRGGQGTPPRDIPVHPTLQRLGLFEFVEERRRTHPGERLFSEYKAIQEQAGMLFSRAFVQWIKATAARLPAEHQRLFADDYHFPSLRALFVIQALSSAMDEAILRTILGTGDGAPTLSGEERDWHALAGAEMARVDIESCFPPLCPYPELMA